MKTPLTAARLRELIHYDPETGIFSRILRCGRKKIGWTATKDGYLGADVDGRPYLLHRLAFLYMTGEMPKGEVDHINGVSSDNRWCNLRKATRGENARNRRMSITNTTGFKGVSKMRDSARWRADICVDGKNVYLGLFKTPEAAHEAYCGAANSLHGQFANHGANDNAKTKGEQAA